MSRIARAAIAIGVASLAMLFVVSLARPAWALCPNCLAQRSVLTPTLKLLGLFLLVPFAVAAIVAWVVRRVVYGRAGSALPSSAPPSRAGGDQGG